MLTLFDRRGILKKDICSDFATGIAFTFVPVGVRGSARAAVEKSGFVNMNFYVTKQLFCREIELSLLTRKYIRCNKKSFLQWVSIESSVLFVVAA